MIMAYSVHNCLPNLLPPFPEFKESVLTPEQIANNLRDEMKRLKKRREFRGQVRCGALKMQLLLWKDWSPTMCPIFVLISSNSWHRALPRLVRRPPHRSRCWRRTWWKGRRARAARHLRPPPPPSRTSPSSPSSRWAWSVRQRVTYTFTSCSRLQQYPQINLRWILLQFHFSAERMCAERVEQVRAEYDQILQQKLSEQVSFWLLICLRYTWSHCSLYLPFPSVTSMSPQYDAFVKFIDHQIQKRFNESMAPSYLS